jgi:hypothetical protein
MRNISHLVEAITLLQDQNNPNILYLGTNYGLYRSLDRGASWSSLGVPSTSADKGKPAASTEPSANAAAAAAAPSSSATRSRVVTKKPAAKPNTAAKPKGKTAKSKIPVAPKPLFLKESVAALAHTWSGDGRVGLLAATNSGLYRTFNVDKGWQLITYGAGLDKRSTSVMTFAGTPGTIWAGTVSSGLLVTHDNGATWQTVVGVPSVAPVTVIVQDPRQPSRLYVGTRQTLYASQDGGATWRRRGGGLPFGEYYSIVINPQNSNEILAGNAYQHDAGGAVTLVGGGLYRSSDGGDTWERMDAQDAKLPSQRIWALAFDPNEPGRLLVGSHSSGIYLVRPKVSVAVSGDTPRK